MTVEVHHVAEGPEGGPVVVLSPSLGSDLRMWNAQASALADDGYRVVRYDHRGHGKSPAPAGPYTLDELGADAVALLDRIGADRVQWVGLSLGGMVGMWLAEQAPERLGRLVLCCTSAKLGPREMWDERIATVRAGGTVTQAGPAAKRWLTDGFRAANPDAVALAEDMVTGTPDEGYIACCAAIRDMDLTVGLPSITAPTLVIAGAQDKATPPDHAERIAAAIPGARLEVLDPGAHLVAVEQADQVTELIIEHLGGRGMSAYEDGMAVRREVLGDEYVDRAIANATKLTESFQDYLTSSVWGGLWTRPGLDRRARSCVTLAVLTALRAHDELALHVRGALRNGLTREEIAEVVMHAGGYAGVPQANSALAVVKRVLSEVDGA